MRKILIILTAFIVLTACGTTSTNAGKEPRFTNADGYLFITEDTKTGCKYLVFRQMGGQSGGAGITPLLKSDGTADCN